MKKLALICLLCCASINASAVTIASYDIQNATTSGYGLWNHTYDGTISSLGSNTANYSGGSGTLNDGLYQDRDNNHVFDQGLGLPVITLYLDSFATLNSISLFGWNLAGTGEINTIPGTITSVDVTINGVTETISTTPFGPVIYEVPVHDLIDLNGTLLDSVKSSEIILSNFIGDVSGYFNITEIEIDGSSVPLPGAVWLLGSALLGFASIAKRKLT
jgi:hypothetical protein